MKVASFFSGIGGIDLGLERAGMEVVFQCEINRFGQEILKKHWPTVQLEGDINEVKPESIPTAELWCGGFPCQDLSLANQGKRQGLEGARSGLFYMFAELIRAQEKKPRWVFMENVPGLLNSRKGDDFRRLLYTMDELGYGVSWRVLDAKYFGTPQRRRRVYIVASYRSLRSAEVLFEPGATGIVDKAGGFGEHSYAEGFEDDPRITNYYAIQHAGIGRIPSAGPQAKGYRNDGETYTCDSRGSSDAICKTDAPFGIRASSGLSTGLDSNRWRALGNAVAVPVIEWIGNRIATVDEKYYK
jgi:DNA (cytosine-5)-methyltransferase 1